MRAAGGGVGAGWSPEGRWRARRGSRRRVSGELKGSEPGGSTGGAGAKIDSNRGGRRRAGGRAGGRAGAGAGRGEYNSAAARRGGTFGRPGLQLSPSGGEHPIRPTPEPEEERVAGARRAKLRAAAGERNFTPPVPAAALDQHFSGGSRQPGSLLGAADQRSGRLGR